MSALLALALAAQGPVIDADAGFFGDAYYDSWGRLSVVVSNPGAEIEGELRAVVRNRVAEAVVYRRAVTLPAKARKRFGWDAYLSGWENEVEYQVLARDGTVLSRSAVPLKFLEERERQVLQVGTALSSLLGLEESLDAAFAQTAPDRLPDTIPPLLALDAIVFPEPQPLEPAQEEALLRWVELGGRLVFGPGRGSALQGRFWRDLLPLASPGTRTVEAGEEGTRVPLVSGRLRAGGAFLALAGQPAGFRVPRGRGEVVFLAFPPDQEGIEDELPAASLWRAALDPPRRPEDAPPGRRDEDERVSYQSNTGFMSGLGDHDAPVPLLALLGGAAALLGYVAWIGPWHYFRLRRRGRLRRGPAAFATAAGVFLMLSLAWATVFAARQVRLHHLVLADEGLVQTFSVLQAGESRVYDLEGTGAFAPMERLFHMGRLEQGREPELDERLRARVPLPALATRGLAGARVPGPEEFGVSCRWIDRPAGRIEIVNDGPLYLGRCRIVTRDGIRYVGSLGSGARRTVDLGALPREAFGEWLRKNMGERSGWWWWSGMDFWAGTPTAEHAFLVSFYEALQRGGEARGALRRFRQRRLDLSERLERGDAVFTGAFEADRSGIRLAEGADLRAEGIVRAVASGGAP